MTDSFSDECPLTERSLCSDLRETRFWGQRYERVVRHTRQYQGMQQRLALGSSAD